MVASDVERALAEDLDALVAIEARAAVRPWQPAVFAEELARDFSRVMVVRVPPASIVAFVVYWQVRDEIHILNLATDPLARRQGYAARLLEHTIAFARRESCASLLLEVRRSNEAALRLYRKYGFRPIGLRAGYYAEEHEDAIVMQLAL